MLKRANQLLATASDWIRTVLLAAATNEMLFFFAAFLLPAVLNTELFRWYPEQVEAYGSMIVVPWGMALCLYRLGRRSGIRGEAQRADIAVLFVLLGWIVVPFWIRYGLTESNVSSWVGHATVYFALYAMTSEESSKRREELFDQVCAMLCALSLLLGGALLWCAWNSAWIDADWAMLPNSYFGAHTPENTPKLADVIAHLAAPENIRYEEKTTIFTFADGKYTVIGEEELIGDKWDGVDLLGVQHEI